MMMQLQIKQSNLESKQYQSLYGKHLQLAIISWIFSGIRGAQASPFVGKSGTDSWPYVPYFIVPLHLIIAIEIYGIHEWFCSVISKSVQTGACLLFHDATS